MWEQQRLRERTLAPYVTPRGPLGVRCSSSRTLVGQSWEAEATMRSRSCWSRRLVAVSADKGNLPKEWVAEKQKKRREEARGSLLLSKQEQGRSWEARGGDDRDSTANSSDTEAELYIHGTLWKKGVSFSTYLVLKRLRPFEECPTCIVVSQQHRAAGSLSHKAAG